MLSDFEQNPSLSYKYVKPTLGIVAKTSKETGKNTVGIYIPRLMVAINNTNGAEEVNVKLSRRKLLNSEFKNLGKESVTTRNYIELSCFTIPNIGLPRYEKGEKVSVMFMDDDIKSMTFLPFGWNDLEKRQTDIAEFYVPAKENETDELTPDNMYRVFLDSKNKKLIIFMSNANGEKSTYALMMDGENGSVSLSDANKRTFIINTEADSLEMKNEAGSFVKVEKTKIVLDAEDIEVNAQKSFTLTTKQYKETSDSKEVKASKLEEIIDSVKRSGQKHTFDYQTLEEFASKKTGDYSSKIIYSSPLFSIDAPTTMTSLGFKTPKGLQKLPTSPGVDDMGSGTFAYPALIGRSVALADMTGISLQMLANSLDLVLGIFGIPPFLGAAIQLNNQTMPSSSLKG